MITELFYYVSRTELSMSTVTIRMTDLTIRAFVQYDVPNDLARTVYEIHFVQIVIENYLFVY